MKMCQYEPVDRPKDFDKVRFTKGQWDEAVKIGRVSGTVQDALEAIRNSAGLYRIVQEDKPEMELVVGGLKISEMDAEGLKLMALNLGIRLGSKRIKTSDLRALIERKVSEIEVVDDDADVSDE